MADRSRKTYLVLVALLMGAAGLSPYVIGGLIEKNFSEKVSSVNKSLPLNVDLVFYKRSWLSSRAITQISIPPAGLHFNFIHVIHHGPFNIDFLQNDAPLFNLATITTTKSSQGSNSFSQNSPSQRMDSRIAIGGDIKSTTTPFDFTSSDFDSTQYTVRTGLIIGQFHSKNDGTQNSAWSEIRSFSLVDNNFELHLDDAFARATHWSEDSESFVKTHIDLDALEFKSDNVKISAESNWVQAVAQSDESNDQIALSGATERLYLFGETLTDLSYDISLSGTSPSSTNRSALPLDNASSATTTEQFVLPEGLVIEIQNLEFQHRNRMIKGWVHVTVTQNTPCCQEHIIELLQHLNLQAELIADADIVFEVLENRTRDVINQTDAFGEMVTFSDEEAAPLVENSVESQLNVLQSQRYLDYDGKNYSARIALENGHFTINDKPLLLHQFVR